MLRRGYLTLCPLRAEDRHPASYRDSGDTQLPCALHYLYPRSHLGKQGMSAFCTISLAFILYMRNLPTLAEHIKWTNVQKFLKSVPKELTPLSSFPWLRWKFLLQGLIISLSATYVLKSIHFWNAITRTGDSSTFLPAWAASVEEDGQRRWAALNSRLQEPDAHVESSLLTSSADSLASSSDNSWDDSSEVASGSITWLSSWWAIQAVLTFETELLFNLPVF